MCYIALSSNMNGLLPLTSTELVQHTCWRPFASAKYAYYAIKGIPLLQVNFNWLSCLIKLHWLWVHFQVQFKMLAMNLQSKQLSIFQGLPSSMSVELGLGRHTAIYFTVSWWVGQCLRTLPTYQAYNDNKIEVWIKTCCLQEERGKHV